MRRYRWKIVLLSLGVVLGYGSAVAHLVHGRGHLSRHLRNSEPCSWFDPEPQQEAAKKLQ